MPKITAKFLFALASSPKVNKPIENLRESPMFVLSLRSSSKKDEEIPVTTTKEIQHLFYHKSPANKTIYKIHAKNPVTHKTHLKPG